MKSLHSVRNLLPQINGSENGISTRKSHYKEENIFNIFLKWIHSFVYRNMIRHRFLYSSLGPVAGLMIGPKKTVKEISTRDVIATSFIFQRMKVHRGEPEQIATTAKLFLSDNSLLWPWYMGKRLLRYYSQAFARFCYVL